jgi:hypothetical protein
MGPGDVEASSRVKRLSLMKLEAIELGEVASSFTSVADRHLPGAQHRFCYLQPFGGAGLGEPVSGAAASQYWSIV